MDIPLRLFPDPNKAIQEIQATLSTDELLLSLAEEASELSQAALKLRRARTGDNWTPKSEKECMDNLTEEIGDVMICLRVLNMAPGHYGIGDGFWNNPKLFRWASRLREHTKKEETNEN